MNRITAFTIAAFALNCTLTTGAYAKSDKEFLADAIKGDNSEVALGEMAAKMGSSDGIRTFGQTLATDHSKAKKEASAVAASMKMKAPSGMKPEAVSEMKKLNGLAGMQFDKEFASYMVADHQKDIAEFESEAKKGSGAAPKLAEKTLPTLRKHLQMAQSLSGT
jgi:putative membrane protein